MSKLKLLCITPGDDETFPVDIDKTQTVGDLKTKIKEAMAPDLDTIMAFKLKLYRINVDISDDKNHDRIIDQISRGDFDFKPKDELLSWRLISQFFEKNSGGTIEVLVELPPGEPIDSCLVVPPLRPTSKRSSPVSAVQRSKGYTYVCL